MARPRIGDVAERAGVSKTAVSFAFNRPERLSEATIERILAAADELGYRPSPIARRLAARRTNQIGLVMPQSTHDIFANPFLPELVRGIGDVCDAQGIAVVLVPPAGGSIAAALDGALVDGMILLGLEANHPELGLVARGGIPVVALDVEQWGDAAVIGCDDAGGSRAATEHLLRLGHRDVGVVLIAGHPETAVDETAGISARRMAGIREALAATAAADGGEPINLRIVSAEASEDGGRAAFAALVTDGGPTAVMTMSDAVAIGVLNAARDAGVAVPDELSVVGFDDIPAAAWTHPRLTTVHQPIREKGRLAAQRLIEGIDGRRPARASREILPTRLVLRGTTAPPPVRAGDGTRGGGASRP